ncbi:MAG: MFS transporter [Dehalococcoidia bacterium]
MSTFSAFTNRNFRFCWASNISLYISRWMQMTTLSWFVFDQTESAFMVSLIGFFGLAPLMFFGLFGGVIADFFNKKILIIVSQIITFSGALAMTFLLLFDLLQLWHVYVAIFIPGISWALDMPSRRALVMDILGSNRITNGISLDAVGMHTSKMIGPATAGALIAYTGVIGAYIFMTVIILIGTVSIMQVNLNHDEFDQKSQKHFSLLSGLKFFFTELREAFQYALNNQTIFAVLVITFFMNLLLFPYMQMVSVISREVLSVGPLLMGILMASDGFGALIGSTALASKSKIEFHGRYYLYGSILSLSGLLLFGISEVYFISMMLLFALGLGTSGFGTMQSVIVLLVSKKEFRGRCMGLVTLCIGAAPIGSIILGLSSEMFSTSNALVINSILGLILVIISGYKMTSIRSKIISDN